MNVKRNEFIAKVRSFAASLAEHYGCDVMVVGDDRQNGIWGESLTEYLEKKYDGDVSTEINWHGGEWDESREYECDRPENRVEFRFRFANPCVSVHLDHNRLFAELEFSDWKNGENTGDYKLRQIHAWGSGGGLWLAESLCQRWDDFRFEVMRNEQANDAG